MKAGDTPAPGTAKSTQGPNATEPAAPVRRGRGRPPRLSREGIIDAAVALVLADPAEPLTVKRAADAAGAAPMALYRYFPDRDDLLHAVAERIAEDMIRMFEPPGGATWQERLRAWMHMSRERLTAFPQLLPYIAATNGAAWLPSFELLVEVLEPAELTDEDLARAITLVGNTIVGQALLEARRRPAPDAVGVMRERLDTRDGGRVAAVLDHVPAAYPDLYRTLVDAVVTAVESWSRETSGPAGSSGRTGSTGSGRSAASAGSTGSGRSAASAGPSGGPPRAALAALFSNPERH